MNCINCGLPLKNGKPFCPRCGAAQTGAPVQTDSPAPREDIPAGYYPDHDSTAPVVDAVPPVNAAPPVNPGYAPGNSAPFAGAPAGMPVYPRKPRKKNHTGLIVALSLVGAFALAAIIGAAVLLAGRLRPQQNAGGAYLEYREIIQAAKEDIDRYEDENGVAPVAVYDVNNSGTPDVVFLSPDPSDSSRARLNIAVDDENGAIRRYSPEESRKDFVIFIRKSDGAMFEYIRTEDSEEFRRLAENGSMDETFGRRFDADNYAYEYTYTTVDGNSPDQKPSELYDGLVNELQEDEIVVLLTDEDEEAVMTIPAKNREIISIGSDEALDYFDQIIGGKEPKAAIPDESAAAPTERKPESIDVSELPEKDSLETFLQIYSFAYHTGEDGKDAQKYDCEHPDSLVKNLAAHPTCAELELYPGEKTIESWEIGSDPMKKFTNSGYIAFEKSKILWIMENIYNVPQSKAAELVKNEVDSKDSSLYEFEKDGKTYLCNVMQGVGGLGYKLRFTAAKYDGEKYYIIFERAFEGDAKETWTPYYAEMALKTIDGKKYWTMYLHTADVPDRNTEEAAAVAPTEKALSADIYGKFAGSYVFSSGAGAWGSSMTINSDGTFSGTYHDSNMGESGPGYQSTLYASEFSGTFKNAKKINDYTYYFEVDSIAYAQEPGTSEIRDDGNGHYTKVFFTEGYGISEGGKGIYAYTSDAPFDQLPEYFIDWAKPLIGRDITDNRLDRNCLYVEESKSPWFGSKE